MADSVHRKSHKDGGRKISAPVHRTTTETIRLGEQLDRGHQSLGLSPLGVNSTPNNQCRKKTSSFQITSVTVGSRMSNDAGDDSNDDLDESHTEDNSVEHSRVTDLDVETPSYSEDTFSKEDVFFNASNSALSTAPVIPTSSQYGLAIVPSEGGNAINSTNDSNINTLDINSVTDNNIINLLSSNAKQDTDIREVHSHGRNERFKVVKIESTEPFKRGRWTCMDYLDHTSVNQTSGINAQKVSDPNEVCISYGVTDGGIVVDTTKQSIEDKGMSIDMNGHVAHQDVHASIGVTGANFGNAMTQSVQSQQHNASQLQNQVTSQQIPQYFQSAQQQQQQQQQLGSQQTQQAGGQGATLPSNLQPAHTNNLGQPQSMPQGSMPIITQTNNTNVSTQQNISHAKEDAYVTVGAQNQSLPGQNVCQSTVQQQTSGSASQPSILVTQHQQSQQQQQQQQQQQSLTTQPQMTQISEPMNAMQGMQGIQNVHKVPQSGAQQATSTIHGQASNQTQVLPTGQMQTSPGNAQVQMSQVPTSCQNVVGNNAAGNPATGATSTATGMQQAAMNFHQPETEQDSVAGLVTTAPQSADATLLESLAEVTQSTDEHHALEDNESMSGTSAVAIDNKIEQAMDLVKSHLMFAVREEVEVLKEKIAELMDRINQLEAENSILKSHATPETLAQLSQATTKLSQNNSGSGQ